MVSCWWFLEKKFCLLLGTKLQLNLMEMLQKKLDDAVLDIISLQLIRNPNIKLMPDDIHVWNLCNRSSYYQIVYINIIS